MCTLVIGVDVVMPGSVLLSANRDEDPGRPSDPPGVLSEHPRLVGGRDRRAGGTWLAVREARAVVAILNRRDRTGGPSPPLPGRRSRGTLVMEIAAAAEEAVPFPLPGPLPGRVPAIVPGPAPGPAPGDSTGRHGPALAPLPGGALRRAAEMVEPGRFAPCTLVFASPEASWLMAIDAEGPPRFQTIPPGWHVLTHGDLDDRDEPRTVWLTRELSRFAPGTLDEAERRLDGLLRSHGDAPAGAPPGAPPGAPAVCLHEGRMVTVSSSSVWLARHQARYRHAEGRPCEHPFADRSDLLGPGGPQGRPQGRQ